MMAEGRQEMEWDLSNSILASVINTSRNICYQISASAGGKPKTIQPLDPSKLNAFRK